MIVTLPPLLQVHAGDHVRFPLFCFGEKRSAVGCVLPCSGGIEGTVQIEYRVALPPIAELPEVYHDRYPSSGLHTGIVQIPLEEIEEVVGEQLCLDVQSGPNADCFRAIDAEYQEALEGASQDWAVPDGFAVNDHGWKPLLDPLLEQFPIGSLVEICSGFAAANASGIGLGSKGRIESFKPAPKRKLHAQFKVKFDIGSIWVPAKYLRAALEPPPQTRLFTRVNPEGLGTPQALFKEAIELPWTLAELEGSKWRGSSTLGMREWDPALEREVEGTSNLFIPFHFRVDHLPLEQQREWSMRRVAEIDRIVKSEAALLASGLSKEAAALSREAIDDYRAERLSELQQHPPVLQEEDWVELWRCHDDGDCQGDPLSPLRSKRGQVHFVSSRVQVRFLGDRFASSAPAWALRPLPVRDPLPFPVEPLGDEVPSDGERLVVACPASDRYGEVIEVESCSVFAIFSKCGASFHFEELARRVDRPIESAKRRSPKGQASGWIEERIGNRKRAKPSTSYYYCFEQLGKRQKLYIPSGKLHRVQSLIAERKPIAEVLAALTPPPQ